MGSVESKLFSFDFFPFLLFSGFSQPQSYVVVEPFGAEIILLVSERILCFLKKTKKKKIHLRQFIQFLNKSGMFTWVWVSTVFRSKKSAFRCSFVKEDWKCQSFIEFSYILGFFRRFEDSERYRDGNSCENIQFSVSYHSKSYCLHELIYLVWKSLERQKKRSKFATIILAKYRKAFQACFRFAVGIIYHCFYSLERKLLP